MGNTAVHCINKLLAALGLIHKNCIALDNL